MAWIHHGWSSFVQWAREEEITKSVDGKADEFFFTKEAHQSVWLVVYSEWGSGQWELAKSRIIKLMELEGTFKAQLRPITEHFSLPPEAGIKESKELM